MVKQNLNNKKELKLFHGNVYNYIDSNGDTKIGIYICDTNMKKKVCIVPIDNAQPNQPYITIKNFTKVALPFDFIEVERSQIKSVLRIKGNIAKINATEFSDISTILLNKLSLKSYLTYNSFLQKESSKGNMNFSIVENYYKYFTWFEHKSNLQFDKNIKRNPIIDKYSIYYIETGENIGSELHKMRPAVIFKRCVSNNPNDTSYIVLPITSKTTSSKYSFNTPILVNGKINYIRINDIRRISIKRLVGPLYESGTNNICRLSKDEIRQLNEDFKNYFVTNA
mgnify:CR=1 FL=1